MKILSAKIWGYIAAAVLAALLIGLVIGHWNGSRSCAGAVAKDAVDELQDDQETANELSQETSEQIRKLERTIANLRRKTSEIDRCTIDADTRRLRSAAISAAFPAAD